MLRSMRQPSSQPIRCSARALIVDDGRLVLIKRSKPGHAPYWVTTGGGVEPEDSSVEAALHREVAEEIGGRVDDVRPALVINDDCGAQHIFTARLVAMDPDTRTGTEFTRPERGTYDVVRVPLTSEALDAITLLPCQVAVFVRRNLHAFQAACSSARTVTPTKTDSREGNPTT